tara:strand:- start:25569 stop:26882 length:1314 start_codon:yes stop_codon:yes gene_type:complete
MIKKLLYFTGLKRIDIRDNTDTASNIINFDTMNHFYIVKTFCCTNILYIIHITYSFFVILVILIEPIYTIIYILESKGALDDSMMVTQIPKLCFLLISPSLFIIGNNYFKKEHFFITFNNIKNSNLTYFNNESKIIITTLVCTTISIIITFLGEYIYNNPLCNITSIYIGDIGILISLLGWVYGRLIIFLNLIIFFLIFSYHKNELENTAMILSDKDWLKTEQFVVSDICYQLLKLKTKMEESITNLESIYTFSTMLGTIGIGVFFQTIENYSNYIFICVCICIFIIIQFIFIYYMRELTLQRKNLLKIIQSNKFTKTFLKRNGKNKETPQDPFKTLITLQRFAKLKGSLTLGSLSNIKLSPPPDNSSIDKLINKGSKTPDWIRDNGSSIDWIILYTILKERWISFSLFGLTFEDGDAFKKGIALSAMLVAANSITI